MFHTRKRDSGSTYATFFVAASRAVQPVRLCWSLRVSAKSRHTSNQRETALKRAAVRALKKDFFPYSVLSQSSKLLVEPTPGFVATHTSAAGQRQEAVSAARRVTEFECSPLFASVQQKLKPWPSRI
jgi:hypothetical protein